jgi:hypothetical protein
MPKTPKKSTRPVRRLQNLSRRLCARFHRRRRLVEVQQYICSGNDGVASTCPFTLGEGLNNGLLGDIIVKLEFNQNCAQCVLGPAAQGYLPGVARIGVCSANGSNWVVDNAEHPIMYNRNAFINVYASDYWGHPTILDSNGKLGGPVYLNLDSQISGGFGSWGWVYR